LVLLKAMAGLALLTLLLTSALPQALAASPRPREQIPAGGSTCLEGGTSGLQVQRNMSVAVIKPVFTSTPYSEYPTGSFYAFYKKYVQATGNITTDLGWLTTSVKLGMGYQGGWGHTFPLYQFLSSSAAKNCGLVMGKNLEVISDINVTQGALFNPDGSRRFDALVIGHTEYVTQTEYDQLRLFVAAGGRLVAMSSNMFYGRVTYDPVTMLETFRAGHGGYGFNGVTAWHNKTVSFARNTSEWTGSSYCCFHRFTYSGGVANASNTVGAALKQYYGGILDPTYTTHEENAVTNFTRTSVVATFHSQAGLIVAAYIHRYVKGSVFCLCVFGEDSINSDPSTQYFLVASIAGPIPAGLGFTQPSHGAGAKYLMFGEVGLVIALLVAPTVFLLWRYAGHRRHQPVSAATTL
jgi:hypothetical protein